VKATATALALLLPWPAAAACTGPVCNFDTLAPVLAKLAEAREAEGRRPVHLLQIGDSHTAGDAFTGGWRTLLQAEWGDGGRGVLPPGRPYAGYFARGAGVTMSDGWKVAASFGKGSTPPRPPLGLSGFSLTATRPGARMALATAFDRFVLCAVSGSVDVRFGDATGAALEFSGPRCDTLQPGAQSSVELVANGATITSWASFRDDGGVALSNLGIIGAQLVHFSRTDDAVLTEELAAYAPDLIVLAFGTNEGFAPAIDTASYEATLRAAIERLQRLAPETPILLLGPPDALSRRPGLRGDARYCRTIPGVAPVFPPPGLDQVRAVQRRVAGDLGLAWWDWQARMGGTCWAQRWVNADPPLMRGDYVHFNSAGGARLAQLLNDDFGRVREAR
jgi:lysophospholipase L1-like esterase